MTILAVWTLSVLSLVPVRVREQIQVMLTSLVLVGLVVTGYWSYWPGDGVALVVGEAEEVALRKEDLVGAVLGPDQGAGSGVEGVAQVSPVTVEKDELVGGNGGEALGLADFLGHQVQGALALLLEIDVVAQAGEGSPGIEHEAGDGRQKDAQDAHGEPAFDEAEAPAAVSNRCSSASHSGRRRWRGCGCG